MIADDQVMIAIQLAKVMLGRLAAIGAVANMDHHVAVLHPFIVPADQLGIHFVDVLERTRAQFDDSLVAVMLISGEENFHCLVPFQYRSIQIVNARFQLTLKARIAKIRPATKTRCLFASIFQLLKTDKMVREFNRTFLFGLHFIPLF